MKYIVFDTEAGGTYANQHSLLTAYFKIVDENFNLIKGGELSLSMKPEAKKDNHTYHVTAEALEVNGINLIEHEKKSISMSLAKPLLYNFIREHSEDGKHKLIPVGHNIRGDINFLFANLINKGNWQQYVSYRHLDTGTLIQEAQRTGKIPRSVSGSLSSVAKHFKIDFLGAHNAKFDVEMTIEIWKKLAEI